MLARSDELLARSLSETERRRRVTAVAGRVILALDGLQPEVGPEVLWVLRDCLRGEVLLARSLLASTQDDRARLLTEVPEALAVPIPGAVSEGPDSLPTAVQEARPGGPHQLGHCPSRREAAQPSSQADRPAQKALQKRVRGGRPLERKVEGRDDPEAKGVQGSWAAVRSAVTEEAVRPGRPRGWC